MIHDERPAFFSLYQGRQADDGTLFFFGDLHLGLCPGAQRVTVGANHEQRARCCGGLDLPLPFAADLYGVGVEERINVGRVVDILFDSRYDSSSSVLWRLC